MINDTIVAQQDSNDKEQGPLRNQTTLEQERHTYDVFRQLCQGKDLEPSHILRKLKLNTDVDKGKGWLHIPALAREFGLWQHTVKQIYMGFLGTGAPGDRMGIIILSITDESLCGLIRRYSTTEELTTIFNWPAIWSACQCYKHRWCDQLAQLN